MAFQSVDKTGVGSDVAFGYWFGPSGRDCNGRFVKRGSELECAYLGPMKYTARDSQRGLKILGAVCGARLKERRSAPCT